MNNLFAAAAAGVLALFGSSTADHRPPPFRPETHGTSTERRDERHATSTRPIIDVQCVAAAVSTREATLSTASAAYGSSISAAYTARATALASAYQLTGKTEVKTAAKNAWKQFQGALVASKKGWQSSKEGAWNAFKTAIKSCGGSSTSIVDQSSSGGEMSGQ